ncbi:MAG TPA: hypothetical protein VMH78_07915 [Thermoplasmata archaeon]|nr:hypothetical protein [Thermoplasmata archaeon]
MAAPPVPFDRSVTAEAFLRGDADRLRAGPTRGCVARLSDLSVSLGVRDDPAGPAARRAAALGLPVLRRTTGGRGLLHRPGDLAWSIVLSRGDPRVGRDFPRAFDRLGSAVVEALAESGLRAAWRPGAGDSSAYCLLDGTAPVLGVGDRIVGGAAQHATATALLHHGVVALTADPASVARLFDVPLPVAVDRLGGLAERGASVDPDALGERLARALGRFLDAGSWDAPVG